MESRKRGRASISVALSCGYDSRTTPPHLEKGNTWWRNGKKGERSVLAARRRRPVQRIKAHLQVFRRDSRKAGRAYRRELGKIRLPRRMKRLCGHEASLLLSPFRPPTILPSASEAASRLGERRPKVLGLLRGVVVVIAQAANVRRRGSGLHAAFTAEPGCAFERGAAATRAF